MYKRRRDVTGYGNTLISSAHGNKWNVTRSWKWSLRQQWATTANVKQWWANSTLWRQLRRELSWSTYGSTTRQCRRVNEDERNTMSTKSGRSTTVNRARRITATVWRWNNISNHVTQHVRYNGSVNQRITERTRIRSALDVVMSIARQARDTVTNKEWPRTYMARRYAAIQRNEGGARTYAAWKA